MQDDMRMPSRPAYVPGNGMGAPVGEPAPKSNKSMWMIVGVIVVVLVVLGVLFRDKLMGSAGGAVKDATNNYKAVFLTNGQVYFGHLTNVSDEYVKLTDIFYLQVTPLQGAGAQQGEQQQQQQLSLVKLGNELHAPVDEMQISRAQILFFEDLKADGKVVEAIKQYKANPNGAAAPAPAGNAQGQSAAPAAPATPPANTK